MFLQYILAVKVVHHVCVQRYMDITGKPVEQSCPHKCNPNSMEEHQDTLLSLASESLGPESQQPGYNPHEETQAQAVIELDEEPAILR